MFTGKYVRCYQLELWCNCRQGCDWCYVKDVDRSSFNERRALIHKAIDTVKSIPDEFNAISLVGGEFFDGQLVGLEDEWMKLVDSIRLRSPKEVWVLCTLTNELPDIFWQTIDSMNASVHTSYDARGRFKSDEQRDQWFENIELLSGYSTHCAQILTQDTVTREPFLPNVTSHAYSCPFVGIYSLTNSTAETYHDAKMSLMPSFPEYFFPKRADVLSFLTKVPPNILKYTLIDVRADADRIDMLTSDTTLDGRTETFNRRFNLDCGHRFVSQCYRDSDACCACDAEMIISR